MNVLFYLIIGACLASVLSGVDTSAKDGAVGYPKSVFTKFEYFLIITCWPLVFILILCLRIYTLLKDKIL